eukprot:360366-Chlamydomonas_euryale.AAC.2
MLLAAWLGSAYAIHASHTVHTLSSCGRPHADEKPPIRDWTSAAMSLCDIPTRDDVPASELSVTNLRGRGGARRGAMGAVGAMGAMGIMVRGGGMDVK